MTFPAWLAQRTRWFKGWLQTLAVHLRDPAATWRELGPRGFFALIILMGGIVLSAMAYPIFMTFIVFGLIEGDVFGFLPVFWSEFYLIANLWNLFAGLIAAIALGWFGLRIRGLTGWGPFGLTKDLLAIPVYWLLISIAAYRAVWQVATKPFLWEKPSMDNIERTGQSIMGRLLTSEKRVSPPLICKKTSVHRIF